MADEKDSLVSRVEAACNTVDAVLKGLQEVSERSTIENTLWAFSNALKGAQPALEEAFALIEKAREVANG